MAATDVGEQTPGGPPAPAMLPLQPAEEPYSIFDKRQRACVVLIVSIAATCKTLRVPRQEYSTLKRPANKDKVSGFSSNIYFPAIPTIADDLGVSNELVNVTVTSYLIFQGLAPSLWGPVSDVKGRRLAYCCTFLVFLGACVGLAESKNYASLIVLR